MLNFNDVLNIENPMPREYHITWLPSRIEALSPYLSNGYFRITKSSNDKLFNGLKTLLKEERPDGPITIGDLVLCAISTRKKFELDVRDMNVRQSRLRAPEEQFDREIKEVASMTMGALKAGELSHEEVGRLTGRKTEPTVEEEIKTLRRQVAELKAATAPTAKTAAQEVAKA